MGIFELSWHKRQGVEIGTCRKKYFKSLTQDQISVTDL